MRTGTSGSTGSHRLQPLVRSHIKSIKLILPSTVKLEAHLDASKDHFLSSLKVNSKLHDIAIVDWKRFTLLRRWAQTNMIQKCAGRALDILDIPFSILIPKFAVSATDNLALKPDRRGRRLVSRHVRHGMAVALRVATNANLLGTRRQSPRNGGECQGWACRSRVVVG